jgi:hypothetical protein
MGIHEDGGRREAGRDREEKEEEKTGRGIACCFIL